jgi:HD-GYP domain-containing protein (c-di-GMP phosphodiesterase class II)
MQPLLDRQLKASKIIASAEADGRYAPLPLRRIVTDWEVPFDLYVKLVPKGSQEPQFVLCCRRDTAFTEEWWAKLQDLRVPCVYYATADEKLVLQYLNHNLRNFLSDEQAGGEEKVTQICDVSMVWLRHFFHEEKERTGQMMALALENIDDLFDVLQREQATSGFVMNIWRHDQDLYTHSLNICLMGLAFVNYLGWSRSEALAFGLGCLLHDIGMTLIPKPVLQKNEKLTEVEWQMIRKHPTSGFHLLGKFTGLSREVLRMVLEHHENGDGSGYPGGLKMVAIHPWSRILRMLDSYEAITAPRRWRPARGPLEALLIIRRDWQESKKYDLTYLKAFIKFLGGSSPESAPD